MELILQTLPFSELLTRVDSLPEHVWIYSDADVDRFDLSTLVSLYEINGRDLTDDEADENEMRLSKMGLEVALSKQQLVDVIVNARQRGVSEPGELMRHIDYYIFHDAYLPD